MRWTWLTKLAGCYAPRLCRQWAKLLCDAAPGEAVDASCAVQGHWEIDLAREIHVDGPTDILQPRCPASFRLPWPADAEFALGAGSRGGISLSTSRVSRAPGRRAPACSSPAPRQTPQDKVTFTGGCGTQ